MTDIGAKRTRENSPKPHGRRPRARRPVPGDAGPRTLCMDIGGSGLKASVVSLDGALLADRVRLETPADPKPRAVLRRLWELTKELPAFDRVSVGFPGVVRQGTVWTAPNLGTRAWAGFELARALERMFGKPVKVANDADLHGLAVIAGRGLEMVWTLGTGFGTGLYQDGRLAPHVEWAHHPFRKRQTYEEQLGNAARVKVGKRRWNRRLRQAIDVLRDCVQFDHLYIGGGNAKHVTGALPQDVKIVSNVAGILGGIHLWNV